MLQIRMKIYSRIPQMGSNSFYFFPHQPLSLLPHSKIICSLTSLSLCINMFPFLCLGNSLFIHSSDSYPFLLCLLKFYLLWEDSPGWHGVFIYFFCPHFQICCPLYLVHASIAGCYNTLKYLLFSTKL